MEVLRVEGESHWAQTFYIPEGIDWDYLRTLGTAA